MITSLKELINEPELSSYLDSEESFISSSVSWENYEALLAKLEDNCH